MVPFWALVLRTDFLFCDMFRLFVRFFAFFSLVFRFFRFSGIDLSELTYSDDDKEDADVSNE